MKCFQQNTRDEVRYLGGDGQIVGAITAEPGAKQQNYIFLPHSEAASKARRLTPGECEVLQGFPIGHTSIVFKNKQAADGTRVKCLGNSMAVSCMAWIGSRIHGSKSWAQ